MAAPEKDPAMVGTNNEKAKCSSRELDGQRSSGDDDLVKQEKSNLNVTTATGTAANSTSEDVKDSTVDVDDKKTPSDVPPPVSFFQLFRYVVV